MTVRTAFGQRTRGSQSQAAAVVRETGRAWRLVLAGLALALFGASHAAWTWLVLLEVPFDRPVPPLFSNGPASSEGWAPWWVAPLASALAGWLLHRRMLARPDRGLSNTRAALGATFAVALASSMLCHLIKNTGYVWLSVPGTTILDVVGALPPMGALASANALALVAERPAALLWPLCIGLVIAVLLPEAGRPPSEPRPVLDRIDQT